LHDPKLKAETSEYNPEIAVYGFLLKFPDLPDA